MKNYLSLSAVALLELMLATAILGLALTNLGIAVGRCVRGVSSSDNVQIALDLAENYLQEWKIANSLETEIQVGSYSGEKTVRNRKFEWHQNVEETDDAELLKSTLAVSWKEGSTAQEQTFVSLVQRHPEVREQEVPE